MSHSVECPHPCSLSKHKPILLVYQSNLIDRLSCFLVRRKLKLIFLVTSFIHISLHAVIPRHISIRLQIIVSPHIIAHHTTAYCYHITLSITAADHTISYAMSGHIAEHAIYHRIHHLCPHHISSPAVSYHLSTQHISSVADCVHCIKQELLSTSFFGVYMDFTSGPVVLTQ